MRSRIERLLLPICTAGTLGILVGPAGGSVSPTAILTPTADRIERPRLGGHLLVYPPGLTLEGIVPLRSRISFSGFVGYNWLPNGFGVFVSGSVRASLLAPTASRAGLLAQAQWIGGAGLTQGEGSGGSVQALELIGSSPIRPLRAHGGIVLHTLPGSEYPGGAYDWANPQLTAFVSGEAVLGRIRFVNEWIWGAIGADDGHDSLLIGLFGLGWRLGAGELRLATGLGWTRLGASGGAEILLPLPPLLSFTHSFGS